MSEDIKPALDPTEWVRAIDPAYHWARYSPESRRVLIPNGDDRVLHATAALALYGQPYGFTHAMVDGIRALADFYSQQATQSYY
jgi:hypothetical protein